MHGFALSLDQLSLFSPSVTSFRIVVMIFYLNITQDAPEEYGMNTKYGLRFQFCVEVSCFMVRILLTFLTDDHQIKYSLDCILLLFLLVQKTEKTCQIYGEINLWTPVNAKTKRRRKKMKTRCEKKSNWVRRCT